MGWFWAVLKSERGSWEVEIKKRSGTYYLFFDTECPFQKQKQKKEVVHCSVSVNYAVISIIICAFSGFSVLVPKLFIKYKITPIKDQFFKFLADEWISTFTPN